MPITRGRPEFCSPKNASRGAKRYPRKAHMQARIRPATSISTSRLAGRSWAPGGLICSALLGGVGCRRPAYSAALPRHGRDPLHAVRQCVGAKVRRQADAHSHGSAVSRGSRKSTTTGHSQRLAHDIRREHRPSRKSIRYRDVELSRTTAGLEMVGKVGGRRTSPPLDVPTAGPTGHGFITESR